MPAHLSVRKKKVTSVVWQKDKLEGRTKVPRA
jgi:hypothetical protein